MRAWDLQNIMATPTPLGLAIGFGLCAAGAPLAGRLAWPGTPAAGDVGLARRHPRLHQPAGPLPAADDAAACSSRWRGWPRGRAAPGFGAAAGAGPAGHGPRRDFWACCSSPCRRRRRTTSAARSGRGVRRLESTRPGSPLPCARRSPTSAAARVPEAVVGLLRNRELRPTPHGQALRVRALRADRRFRPSAAGRSYHFFAPGARPTWRLERVRLWRARSLRWSGPYERKLGAFDPSLRPRLGHLHVEGAGGPRPRDRRLRAHPLRKR